MKKKTLLLFVLGLVTLSFTIVSFTRAKENPDKDKLLIEIISYVLTRGHYSPSQLDDTFSENVFMNYIEALDGRHRFFLQADINNFTTYKYKLDDEIKNTKIDFFTKTYDKYLQRLNQVKAFYPELLEKPFDFSKNETIDFDYENMGYSPSLSELKKRWRKNFKFDVLRVYADKKESELLKQEEDSTYVPLNDKELEIASREVVKEDMERFYESREDLERKDFFSVYVNAIALQFDPHTTYFAPEDKDRFDMGISGKFEGIGARLQKKNQQIEIVEVISGGPVWRDQLLEPGDRILKVAQVDSSPVDIVGMRLDDVIKLIKGPKGTQVFLTVKRVDGTIEEVVITRDVIELEEAFAKSTLIKKDGKKYGLIFLPKFYIDFDDYNQRNAASDVRKEIEKLKKEGIEGLIMDLRGNGGGSLQTVVDMTGFFIDQGPVVQVKSTGGQKQVLKDKEAGVAWDGPLVVMVNGFSASASEILAAALQDYKRAVILGSKQTYGKGTVQNIIDLNKIIAGNSYGDLGAMKITTDKFYRINGGSTQLEGVKSDIVFPDRYALIETGEKDQDNPLSWDQISSVNFTPWTSPVNYDYIEERSKKRMAESSFIQLINEQAAWIKAQQNDYEYSLNYENFVDDIEMTEAQTKKFNVLSDYQSSLEFAPSSLDLKQMGQDEELQEKRKRWEESLGKDLYVNEAVEILEDMYLPNAIHRKKVAQVKQ